MASNYKGNVIGISKKEGILSQKTDLKNWKYKDFLSGPEPFITKNIPEDDIEKEHVSPQDKKLFQRYGESTGVAIERRAEDTARISKFIASGRGVLWETKMASLETIQRELTKKTQQRYGEIQKSDTSDSNFWGKVLGVLSSAGESVLNNIGLTAGTLAQVAASGTGYHGTTYAPRAYLRKGGTNNILTQLLASTGTVSEDAVIGAAYVQGGNNVPVNGTSLPDDRRLVAAGTAQQEGHMKYVGQIDSYSASKHQTASSPKPAQTTIYGTVEYPLQSLLTGKKASGVDLLQTESTAEQPGSPKHPVDSQIRENDLRGLRAQNKYGSLVESEDNFVENTLSVSQTYDDAKKNVLRTVDGGKTVTVRTGKRLHNPIEEDDPLFNKVETVFYHTKFIKSGGAGGSGSVNLDSTNETALEELGLIPFCISTITPERRTYINFPIDLESYDDSYNGNWDSVRYIGRGENFYGYNGFTRSINFNFKVVALHQEDLLELYRRLNKLAGATAPNYDGTGLFMRGTLSCITIGDLLVEQFGFISNLKLTWQKDYLWVPGNRDDGNDSTGWSRDPIMLPSILDVAVSFTPIERNNVDEDYKSFFVFHPKEKTYTGASAITSSARPVMSESSPTVASPAMAPVQQQVVKPQIDHTAVRTMGNAAGGSGGYGSNLIGPEKALGKPVGTNAFDVALQKFRIQQGLARGGNLFSTASF